MIDDKEKRLKALEELSRLDEELGWGLVWPENREIDGLRLVCTSAACPEQYDVFDGDRQVGYLRLRHGRFRADVPDCGGETVYEANPKGDGTFGDEERVSFLAKAVREIRRWMATLDNQSE